MYALGWIPGLLGVLLLALTYLAAAGKITNNPTIGLRTPAIRRDDASWTAGHRAALLPMALVAAVAVPISIPLGMGRVPEGISPETATGIGTGVVVVGAVIACVVADRAARKTTAAASPSD